MVAYNNSALVEQIIRFSSSIDEDGSGGSLDEIIHLHLYKLFLPILTKTLLLNLMNLLINKTH